MRVRNAPCGARRACARAGPPAPGRLRALAALLALALSAWGILPPPCAAQGPDADIPATPLPRLDGASGLWDMPSGRVLPDWNARFAVGDSGPWRHYGAALGLLDRVEVHGRLSEVQGVTPFPGEPYGDYKDRLAGLRVVLLEEGGGLPQVALGLEDPLGTGLYASRYLVLSKALAGADVTLGLAQGVLGGDPSGPGSSHSRDPAAYGESGFLLSSPLRPTGLFAGVQYPLADSLFFCAEYSPMNYARTLGGREAARLPVNAGLKWRPAEWLTLSGALMRGRDPALGLALSFPLRAEGLRPWRAEPPPEAGEAARWDAAMAPDDALARLLADALWEDGFRDQSVAVSGGVCWAEAANARHLSEAKALGRMGQVLLAHAPPRVEVFYLGLKRHGRVSQALRTGRDHLRAFLEDRVDREGFLAFVDWRQDGEAMWQRYLKETAQVPALARKASPPLRGLSWDLGPKLRTFLNNRKGFFLHKLVLRLDAAWRFSERSLLAGQVEAVLYNEFDQAEFEPLEDDPARTDLLLYEQGRGARLTMLAFDRTFDLPWGFGGRAAWGIFESAWAGMGAEAFRFFDDGAWGLGLEGELVRKRDPDHPLALGGTSDDLYATAFCNAYWQAWPEQGVDVGLKAGRFLAGDWGARLDVRRTFRHVTVGAWYTVTDTSGFASARNQGHHEQGVYVRIPLSLFRDTDAPGHFRYAVSNFTRDPGQTVRQPRSLFPLSPEETAVQTRFRAGEMRPGDYRE